MVSRIKFELIFFHSFLLLPFLLFRQMETEGKEAKEKKKKRKVEEERAFPDDSVIKNPPANAGDSGLIPGSGRSPGEGNGNPLQYFCLENPMDGGAWQATVHGVAKSWV